MTEPQAGTQLDEQMSALVREHGLLAAENALHQQLKPSAEKQKLLQQMDAILDGYAQEMVATMDLLEKHGGAGMPYVFLNAELEREMELSAPELSSGSVRLLYRSTHRSCPVGYWGLVLDPCGPAGELLNKREWFYSHDPKRIVRLVELFLQLRPRLSQLREQCRRLEQENELARSAVAEQVLALTSGPPLGLLA